VRKRLLVFPLGGKNAAKGWGVKAGEPIQAGEFVCEYVGEIITAAEAERREAACPAAGLYHFELSGGRFLIDAFAVRNVAAFINFSCDPNLEPRRLDALSGDKSLPRVGFFARRDIKTGDELGYRRDPNATTRKNRSGSIVCLCGSKNCVGRV